MDEHTGASHLRFPGQEDSGTSSSSTGSLGDVFTSATECGSPLDSPLASELQVKLECALNRITTLLLPRAAHARARGDFQNISLSP